MITGLIRVVFWVGTIVYLSEAGLEGVAKWKNKIFGVKDSMFK